MRNKLTEYFGSKYFERLNGLRSNDNLTRVRVYVEGHEDVVFWHGILKEYEAQKNIKFIISPHTKSNIKKGKQQVLSHKNKVGKYLILCVDSDYDYLLQGHTDDSKFINENKYVFQTYAYSIENFKCYQDSLHDICVLATANHNKKIDISELLKLYSNIIYPLLLWSLYFESKNDFTTFTRTHFSNLVKIPESIEFDTHFQDLNQNIQTKVASFAQVYTHENEEFRLFLDELNLLGLDEDNAYLFMPGHTLFNKVVLRILRPLCKLLRKEKETEILNYANEIQKGEEIKQYKNVTKRVKDILETNTDFKSCPLY